MRTVSIPILLAAALLLAGSSQTDLSTTPKKGRPYFEKRGEVVWEVPTEEKVIAFTFDDGPDPEDTPQILDLLQLYGAKATFFIIGEKAARYPELVKREAAEGHELANHTYKHTYFNGSIDESNVRDELTRTEDIIYTLTGQKSLLFRPPGGYYSEPLVRIARQEGYLVVMWSWHINTMDWNTPGVDRITKKVLDNARNGDIVLFHDYVEGKTQTIEALKRILPELQSRGYRFVSVSDLLTYRRARPVKQLHELPSQ
ncbi:polysaccharide deacetylase family protein [Paenibacillus agricola]|uniref:Polysaccharide deacetylase family protein n=1 Tax=Paenibacillus agricola TaxID=2716264 RepID=A0ABX0JCX1_9BACL|nr:polysaccharide deacetylase family protein [Paenibacillus agricola]NHN33094.1 polysaccharide deacetylase family protein [Paenibacillus agricola]